MVPIAAEPCMQPGHALLSVAMLISPSDSSFERCVWFGCLLLNIGISIQREIGPSVNGWEHLSPDTA